MCINILTFSVCPSSITVSLFNILFSFRIAVAGAVLAAAFIDGLVADEIVLATWAIFFLLYFGDGDSDDANTWAAASSADGVVYNCLFVNNGSFELCGHLFGFDVVYWGGGGYDVDA